MLKALKAGLFGLALGALGAVALPTQEAEAQIQPMFPCCSSCNPNYQNCVNSAGNNPSIIAECVQTRSMCERLCRHTC
ncbi:hypothetical protein F0U60_50395 [Archangium minus]|uniref:ShKT domain-containing protein n=1 Tax=Archangium minus TaxID=83450 RepID=A0ABY9X7T9_9BACT|nr:hypothetical protein F0U60_50395 [Archangium minus]